MAEKEKLYGYTRGTHKNRWIRVVTIKATNLNIYLRDLPQDVLILSIVPVKIGPVAYRRVTVDIERHEKADEFTRFADDFDFRKMLRGKPIHPRK